ncbi:mediator of RNA polymerase II transcription subunit 20 [Bradysia coprophila]|uniref:mediator of RNA polymerase II transcription subunit 20 n=1 Tax=Bradysia coprophila TaxID=38358 RepID=UPI00187DBF8A|nr:mediator of RNA polymerase II transcription subunit 20 [Bradysia coprophila]
MGVTILQPFPNVENKTGPAIIDFLTKRVVALGAVQAGHFIVDCETYTSVPQMSVQPKIVHLLHNSEHPASVFSILETGTKQIALVADSLFDLLILKMTPAYTSKKQTKIESKGPRFELGDFVIKLGSVTMSQTFKGVMVEVEYRPCVIPSNCWDLIREFMQGFMGSHVPNIIPPYFTAPSMMAPNQNKQNDIYQPIDTVQQYLEHFSNYRKLNNPQPGMGMRN